MRNNAAGSNRNFTKEGRNGGRKEGRNEGLTVNNKFIDDLGG